MKLISLETQGFKRLRNHTFNFTDGLNVIVGDNAAGKSTLLQAIECALYGAAVVPGKKEHMITWGQKTWKVVLHFMVNDLEYQLTRSKSTAKLECSGTDNTEIVANGATPVTQAVEELLGLSAKDYNLFMQSKQGETSGVLTFGAAALNRKVETFSGISTIDDVHQLALEDFRTAKAKIEALSFDEADLGMLHSDLDSAQATAKQLWFDVEAATQALEGTATPESVVKPGSDPDVMQAQRDKVSRLEQRLGSAKREAYMAEKQLGEANRRLEETDKPEDADELEIALAAVKAKGIEAVKEVDRLSRDLMKQQDLFNELAEAEALFNQQRAEDEIGEAIAWGVEYLHTSQEAGKVEAKKEHELAYRLQQIDSLLSDAACPTCGTKLSEHDPEELNKERTAIAEELKKATDKVTATDTLIRKAQSEVERLEYELKAAQAAEAKVDSLREQLVTMGVVLHTGETPTEGELEKAKATKESLAAEKASIDHKLSEIEADQRRYDTAFKSANRALAEHKQALNEVDETQQALATAKEAGDFTDELIAESRELWKEYQRLVAEARVERAERQAELNQAKQSWESACKESERLKGEVERLNQRAEEVKALKVAADQASRLAKFLGERRAGYLQEVWDAVLGAASKQVNLASRGMVSRLSFKDGDFFFEEEGVLAPVASASGAQKAHIGVAVRIGLSRALYGKDALLIFDEPTESMREHHATGLSASLAGAASQCLLITHREQDQDLASNVVEVA